MIKKILFVALMVFIFGAIAVYDHLLWKACEAKFDDIFICINQLK